MKRYITEQELSRITDLAPQTLRNWRSAGKGFPYVKIGKSVRYELHEIELFLEGKRITPKHGLKKDGEEVAHGTLIQMDSSQV